MATVSSKREKEDQIPLIGKKLKPSRQPLEDVTHKQIQRKETNPVDKKEKKELQAVQQTSCVIPVDIALPDIVPLELIPPRVSEASIISLQADARDRDDPFSCTEYVNEIHAHMMTSETRPIYRISKEFLSRQMNISDHHRSVLIDWLVQVQRKFMLLQETLYITVDILDRYLDVSKD